MMFRARVRIMWVGKGPQIRGWASRILVIRLLPERSEQIRKSKGIMAAKKTHDLIPLTHPIPIDEVSVELGLDEERPSVKIHVSAKTHSKTGIEMEVITGVVIAAATIYDMIKAVDRTAVITEVRLLKKSGGKSGDFVREE